MRDPADVFWWLDRAGYTRHLRNWSLNGGTMLAQATPEFLVRLERDERFASGVFYGLHRDVGKDLVDFRSYHGTLGKGSLQVVVDRKTLAVYADIDDHNPYHDLVRFVAHTGDVIGGWVRKVWRRRRG